jgi:gluconolactonase
MARFTVCDGAFESILSSNPSSEILCEDEQQLFHEACIVHDTGVYITSNQIPGPEYAHTSNKQVILSRYVDGKCEEVKFPGSRTAMLNGGVNYDKSSILLCAQGSKGDDINGIIKLDLRSMTTEIVVAEFLGLPFNSVNDVVVHPKDGSIWFTDPCYGYGQGIRNKPVLPNQVYRYDPAKKSIRAVADGFVRPNGLCFSPDLKTMYITDTGAIHGSPDVPFDQAGPSHVYAFDVVGGFLQNRRLFAFAAGRLPDGIKCDTRGNVYSGCGDGIEVWNSAGELLGVIEIEGGVANFCFGRSGEIYACNETRFLRVQLDPELRGTLLDS